MNKKFSLMIESNFTASILFKFFKDILETARKQHRMLKVCFSLTKENSLEQLSSDLI